MEEIWGKGRRGERKKVTEKSTSAVTM